jgi:hypothetical protein
MNLLANPLFSPGSILITTIARDALSAEDVSFALSRHLKGDWGNICPEDKVLNDNAVVVGNRILCSYDSTSGTKFWIITEADRSSTTILLPEEY